MLSQSPPKGAWITTNIEFVTKLCILRQNSLARVDNFHKALKQRPQPCLGVCCTFENIFVWSSDRPRSHLADLIFPLPPFLTWLIGHPRRSTRSVDPLTVTDRISTAGKSGWYACVDVHLTSTPAFINHLRPRGWPLKRQAAPYEAAWTGGGFIWAGKTLRNAYLGSTNAYSPWSDPCKRLPLWPTLYFGPPGGFWPEHIVFSMRGRYSKPRPPNVNIQCFAPECYYEMRMWSTITFLWRNQHPEAQKCPLGNNLRYGKLCWTQKSTTPNHPRRLVKNSTIFYGLAKGIL